MRRCQVFIEFKNNVFGQKIGRNFLFQMFISLLLGNTALICRSENGKMRRCRVYFKCYIPNYKMMSVGKNRQNFQNIASLPILLSINFWKWYHSFLKKITSKFQIFNVIDLPVWENGSKKPWERHNSTWCRWICFIFSKIKLFFKEKNLSMTCCAGTCLLFYFLSWKKYLCLLFRQYSQPRLLFWNFTSLS